MYQNQDPFQAYLKEQEPEKFTKGYAWSTAIGLQAVDGLKPSQYLIDTAIRSIEGEITLDDARDMIDSYYAAKPAGSSRQNRTEEADKVSARIAALLTEHAFSFTPGEYISIHRRLFQGIFPHAGKIRDYNISKKEWVLDGAFVLYGSATELRATLEYDFAQEKAFSYKGLSMEQIIHHLAEFVSRLWQIHVFGEGNTRTTAVFFIKYLRSLGFAATNDIFAQNAWYFRNTLVRANYTDLTHGIYETTEYLELFLRNLLLEEKHPLRNRNLHIHAAFPSEKVDIEPEKVDIEAGKVDIEALLTQKGTALTIRTQLHVRKLYQAYGSQGIFGRSAVCECLGLQNAGASKLLAKLLAAELIEPALGRGKGKYRFVEPAR